MAEAGEGGCEGESADEGKEGQGNVDVAHFGEKSDEGDQRDDDEKIGAENEAIGGWRGGRGVGVSQRGGVGFGRTDRENSQRW